MVTRKQSRAPLHVAIVFLDFVPVLGVSAVFGGFVLLYGVPA